jgi:hypothetical protein
MMIQFHCGKWMGAKARQHGYAMVEDEGLRFALHDGKIERSILDEETADEFVPWTDIDDLDTDHGMLENTLTIALRTPPLPGRNLPGLRGACMTLHVQKKNQDDLDRFATRANHIREGAGTKNIEDALDDINDFLDQL